MITIKEKVEGKRGCGFRKPGGMYLVSDGTSKPCGLLPIPLDVCPYCGAGIKPARGWTWLSMELFKDKKCMMTSCKKKCPPFDGATERSGLIWVGGKYYKTPGDFQKEADRMGVSRRINSVPKDFELGETWVLLAHREASWVSGDDGEDIPVPAIFTAFKPTAIEYIIKGTESFAELERMEKRGITLVQLNKVEAELLTFEETSI